MIVIHSVEILFKQDKRLFDSQSQETAAVFLDHV